MRKSTSSLAALILAAVLCLQAGPAQAQRGGRGGHGGHSGYSGHSAGFSSGYRAGGFSGGYRASGYHLGTGAYYRPYAYSYGYHNYYRPYHHYHGFYVPYYGYGIYWPYYYGLATTYSPYYGNLGLAAYANADPVLAADAAVQQPPAERPPADDAVHLQLLVPENAEVTIDGVKTTQSGATREFVSPALTPGTQYQYKITVRYTDAKGKVVDDTREIRFRANDWFSVDFNRPPPPQPVPAPEPKGKE
jgi:uncharacterized protein (TIGR03000 family)